jgi:hypothetical protein
MNKEYKKILDDRMKPFPQQLFNKNIIDDYSITNDNKIITSQKDLIINIFDTKLNDNTYDNIINKRNIDEKEIYLNFFNKNSLPIKNNTNSLENIFLEQKKKTQDLLDKLKF